MTIREKLGSYQLIAVTISYIFGITASLAFSHFSPSAFLVVPAAALFLLCLVMRKLTLAFVLLLLIFFQTGFLNGHRSIVSEKGNVQSLAPLIGEEVVVLGKIRQMYGFNGRAAQFDMDALSIRSKDSSFTLCEEIIRFRIKEKIPDIFLPGTAVAVRAKLKKPQRYHTPGSFNYPQYLARLGIHLTADISSPLHIQEISISKAPDLGLMYAIERLREKIIRFIDQNVTTDVASIYKAILTGDRSTLSPNILETFKKSGCLHILAVSGLHISILGLLFFTFFFWILRRSERLIQTINTKKTAVLMTIFPLFLYMMLSGGKTPVVRAFVMSLLVILAVCSNRKHTFSALVAFAALIILALSPEALFSPSFQLTFAAVMSISLSAPWLVTIHNNFFTSNKPAFFLNTSKWLIAGCGVSLAATLGTAPLLLYHFNRVSLIGILSNLVVEPLLCFWSLTIGFFALPVIFIQPFIAKIMLQVGAAGITLALKALTFFGSLPLSSIYLPTPPIFLICLYYFFFSVLLIKGMPPYITVTRPLMCVGLVSTIVLFYQPNIWMDLFLQNKPQISFLDVGHGSCTYLRLPSGKRILIDGGSIASPEFDIGQRIIAPFLWHERITKIDEIIVTHPDSDHFNGLPFILEHFNVGKIWLSQKNKDLDSWSRLLQSAEEYGTKVKFPHDEEYIYREDEVSLQIVANTANNSSYSLDKNNGLVVKYKDADFAVLFPGDISAITENRLIENEINLKAGILLAAHHGSATSNSDEFIREIGPQKIIVSAGSSRKILFPSIELMEKCNNYNIDVYPTHTAGTITITKIKGKYLLHTSL